MSVPADELRAAAAKLREIAKDTTRAPWAARNELVRDRRKALEFRTWTIGPAERGEGDLTSEASSEADARWIALMHPGMADLFAAWLVQAARTVQEHPQAADYAGLPTWRWCDGCANEECEGLQNLDKALAVARAINGGQP